MIFEFRKKIYGYDCDIYGHLNNATYLQAYEAARSEALNEMGMPISKLLEKGYMLFLIKVEILYKKAVKLEDIIKINTEIIEHNRMKSVWKQDLYNSDDELCSSACVTGVYVSNGKPTRIDKNLYEFFDKFVKLPPREE